jgi:hypothetical protein
MSLAVHEGALLLRCEVQAGPQTLVPDRGRCEATAKCLAVERMELRAALPSSVLACVRHAVLHRIRIPHLGRSPSCPCQITNIECEAHWLVVALTKELIIFDRRQRELQPCHTIRTLPPPRLPDPPLRTERPLGSEPKREAQISALSDPFRPSNSRRATHP